MKRIIPYLFLPLLAIVPLSALAATLHVVPAQATAGQEFSVAVTLSADGESFNAVEGAIHIPDGLTVTRISTGGSALSLWPVLPAFSRSNNEVSFTGGTTGTELSATRSPLLFTLYLKANAPGSYVLTPDAVSAYRADGKGTRVAVTVQPVSILVGSEAVPTESAADHQAPGSLTASLGSDASLFGGAPFVSFYGTDAGTGITQYEAKEGWFAAYAPVDRYYVLKDASASQPVWIRAIDAAGNARSVHVQGTGGILFDPPAIIALILIIVLAAGFLLWRSRRRTP